MRIARPSSLFVALALMAIAHGSNAQVASPKAVPPVVKTHVDPVYPPGSVAARVHGDVMLALTIDVDGHVSNVAVLESGGALLDEAAVVAARQWTFVPAMRGDTPVASRIRVPFHFAPPEAAPEIVEAPRTPGDVPMHEAVPAKDAPVVPAVEEVHVQGRLKAPTRGPSDFDVTLGELSNVPVANAGALLKLAPGVLITNEGGEGHADGINVRGFEAGEGEAMEISVGHLSLNEPGNYHAHGYADTHVILPELVESVRIQEGPFDPRQGNFAIAGSANYELGLARRGLTAKYTTGSFGTQRMLLMYGPPKESDHTFAGAELAQSDGYGQNRDYKKANAIAQYEGKLGERGSFRVTTMAYAVESHSAGVVRDDDVRAGRIGFYDTYDSAQGQDASRYSIAADLETKSGEVTLAQQLYLVDRSLRIREDFTGYAQDARGDGLDLSVHERTIGGRGWARMHGQLLGQRQELEVGYFARGDMVDDVQQSVARATGKPFATQASLAGTLGEVALYGDANLHVLPWINVRGGVRGELFTYDVNDRCANGNDCQTAPDPTNQRSTAALAAILPRASIILGSFAGFRFTGSYGQGVRSLAIDEVTQDTKGPLGRIDAYEEGVEYAHRFHAGELTLRSVFHDTHVDRDVIFSEVEGRDVSTGGTTRTGWIGAGRFTGTFVDASASASIVRARVDATHESIFYVPQLLVRSDTAFFGDLPWRLAQKSVRASIAPGISYVGVRALPFGQTSAPYALLDAAGSLSWSSYQLSIAGTNLFDSRYRMSEFTFASNFAGPGANGVAPTVARHFTAGAPRGVFVSLAVTLGD